MHAAYTAKLIVTKRLLNVCRVRKHETPFILGYRPCVNSTSGLISGSTRAHKVYARIARYRGIALCVRGIMNGAWKSPTT